MFMEDTNWPQWLELTYEFNLLCVYLLLYPDNFRYKGHDMLAPFTAGWQTTDTEPLVIEKSEVYILARVQFLIYCLIVSENFRKKVVLNDRTFQGSYVYDVNGKKYLDALAGLWCTVLGTLNQCSIKLFLAFLEFVVASLCCYISWIH